MLRSDLTMEPQGDRNAGGCAVQAIKKELFKASLLVEHPMWANGRVFEGAHCVRSSGVISPPLTCCTSHGQITSFGSVAF